MRLGIMQPYFFPYIGHFALIASVDSWIVFDVSQYTPRSWMNRNRILHPKTGWQYITIPLSNSSISIKTYEARVQSVENSKRATLGHLSHYKKTAPYFDKVNEVVNQAFDCLSGDSLVSLNVSALSAVCDYLQIPFSYRVGSQLGLEFPSNLGSGEWAPFICRQLGATEYVNPVGGKDIFGQSDFQDNGVSLYFAEFAEFKYATPSYIYEPNLSILDVMMWNSPEEIMARIKSHIKLVKVV